MSEAVPSSSCVLPDNFTEADGVAQPGDIMLVNSPPDDGEEISRHLMSSLKQHNGQDTNSDSGDSLFITQKCAPQRRRRSSKRSNFRDSPEHEYDASTSEEEHPEDRKQQKKKSCTTPKFTFDFLKERMMTRLPYYQNRKLHYYAMGGYFRCAERLWDSYQTGEDLLESLPTADEDGEPISPMSEEEDETTENEDIRLVEKKLFVVSKTKNSQPWYNPKKGSSEETQQNEERYNAAREPQGRPGRMTLKISTWIPSSRRVSSSKTKESNVISEETESVDDRLSTSGSLPAETETGKNSRSPGKESRASGGLIPVDNGQMLGNESDATCGGVSAEQSDRQATDLHTGADEQTSVQDKDIEFRIIKVKKRKKKKQDREDDKCVEEGQDQSLEGAGGHRPDPSANLIITKEVEAPCMEKRKKKKKKRENQYIRQEGDEQSVQQKEEDFVVCENGNIVTDSLKTNKAAESATNNVHVPKKRKKKKKDSSDLDETTTEHPEAIDHSSNGEVFQETLESNGFKRKKHKKKKSQSPNDNQTDVDLPNDATTWPENTDFVYKKKKKKHVNDQVGLAEEDESVEKTPKEKQDIEQETKKKKKKKMKDDISVSNSEDMLAYGDYSQLVRKKKKTHSVLSADDEEPSPSAHEGCAEKPEVSAGELAAESADDFEHLQESKDGKKKKKRSAAAPESEERELEETSEAPIKNKEKHKRTKRLTETLESVEQSQPEGAVVVKKTKKRKSRGEVPDEESHQTKEDRTNPGAGSRFNSASSKTFPAELATSSSHCVERKRKHNARKRLYNPDKDFLSDLNSSPDRS
ncbi:uncharacterized protein LOC103133876 [Poecilia formosa]|uniref:uncharacterized protein LOC103133876 n=1 Tax=Poecilia formosa TaxID=48698 RepID=UPI000443E051|nr:PREDICTED: uncharacterized protein LOC103133876 [Poecilia formosa]